jgi:branched-chain amino acid transport system substrate-binding protein
MTTRASSLLALCIAWLGSAPVAAAQAVSGLSDGEITFGQSAAFSGPARELGRQMKVGLDVAFAAANEAGGVTWTRR